MKNKAVFYTLVVIFVFTMMIGLLSPQEAEEILEQSAAVILEGEVELPEEVSPVLVEIATDTTAPARTFHEVVRVIDGDTIVINKDDVEETVRLIGIDTPETVHPSKPIQCFGAEASKITKEWLEGEKVYLEIDKAEGERDKYGRMLGYVFRADGFFINLELIRQGYAHEYTYDLPYRYQSEFREAERRARDEGNGLWADGVCADQN